MNTRVVRIAAAVVLALATAHGTSAAIIKSGKVAPAWTLKSTSGKTVSSAQFKGKVVLVNFFSYYCTACHEEYPHLQELQNKYGGEGFTVISITPDADPKEAGAFAKEINATFPVLRDPTYAVHEKFGVEPIPANVIVGRNGKVIATVEGADVKKINAAVARAMAAR